MEKLCIYNQKWNFLRTGGDLLRRVQQNMYI